MKEKSISSQTSLIVKLAIKIHHTDQKKPTWFERSKIQGFKAFVVMCTVRKNKFLCIIEFFICFPH